MAPSLGAFYQFGHGYGPRGAVVPLGPAVFDKTSALQRARR